MVVGEDVAVLADDEAGSRARAAPAIDVDLHDRRLERGRHGGDAAACWRADRVTCGTDRRDGDRGDGLGLRHARDGEADRAADGAGDECGEGKSCRRERDHAATTGLLRARR